MAGGSCRAFSLCSQLRRYPVPAVTSVLWENRVMQTLPKSSH